MKSAFFAFFKFFDFKNFRIVLKIFEKEKCTSWNRGTCLRFSDLDEFRAKSWKISRNPGKFRRCFECPGNFPQIFWTFWKIPGNFRRFFNFPGKFPQIFGNFRNMELRSDSNKNFFFSRDEMLCSLSFLMEVCKTITFRFYFVLAFNLHIFALTIIPWVKISALWCFEWGELVYMRVFFVGLTLIQFSQIFKNSHGSVGFDCVD